MNGSTPYGSGDTTTYPDRSSNPANACDGTVGSPPVNDSGVTASLANATR